MSKTILVTGATDGIGFEVAKRLVADGHRVLLHGRSPAKLEAVEKQLAEIGDANMIETYVADLSDLSEVAGLADAVSAKHDHLDALINNAGVLKTPDPVTKEGLDVRFVVNSLAPMLLTQRLMPLLDGNSRVVNVSSAAQAPVNLNALAGKARLPDMDAYAQSKLAITMWSRLTAEGKPDGPVMIAVNPGSLLASKMVKEGFGIAGSDLGIGADILTRAALDDEFADASGKYYDNDAHRFGNPHGDALNEGKSRQVVDAMQAMIADHI